VALARVLGESPAAIARASMVCMVRIPEDETVMGPL